MRLTRFRTAAATAAVVLAAVGCSGDDDDGAPITTAPRPAATTTVADAGSVPAAGTGPEGTDATGSPVTGAPGESGPAGGATTTAAGRTLPDAHTAGACPALPEVGTSAESLRQDTGDFDADRALDALTTYRQDGEWRIRVALSTGGGIEAVLGGVDGPGATPLGGSDVGGGPGAEPFVVITQGAATTGLAVFSLQDCSLVRVLDAAGAPAVFPVGGTVLNGAGLRCVGDPGGVQLHVLEATSRDGTTFATTSTPMALAGDRLTPAGPAVTGSLTSPADDGALGEFFRVNCGGVAEGS